MKFMYALFSNWWTCRNVWSCWADDGDDDQQGDYDAQEEGVLIDDDCDDDDDDNDNDYDVQEQGVSRGDKSSFSGLPCTFTWLRLGPPWVPDWIPFSTA